MIFRAIFDFVDGAITYPPGIFTAEAALVPVALILIPPLVWSEFASTGGLQTVGYFSYLAAALIVSAWWLTYVFRKIVRLKEQFYRKHVKPTLSSEYRDG